MKIIFLWQAKLIKKIKPLPLFQQYLTEGFYPYYKEDREIYAERLLCTVNVVLETDLLTVENIEIHTIKKIKQLLYIIAQRVPFMPNIKELAEIIEVSRKSLLSGCSECSIEMENHFTHKGTKFTKISQSVSLSPSCFAGVKVL